MISFAYHNGDPFTETPNEEINHYIKYPETPKDRVIYTTVIYLNGSAPFVSAPVSGVHNNNDPIPQNEPNIREANKPAPNERNKEN